MALETPTNGKTSNPENRSWAWGLAGLAVGTVFPVFGTFSKIVGMGIGFISGQYTGQQKAQKEAETGIKTIRKPSLVNGGMAKGLLFGSAIGSLLTLGVGAAASAVSGGTIPIAVTTLTSLSSFAITSVMTVKGAINRRDEMREDYQAAEKLQMDRAVNAKLSPSVARHRAQSQQKAKAASYQFDNSQMVENRQGRQWTDDIVHNNGQSLQR